MLLKVFLKLSAESRRGFESAAQLIFYSPLNFVVEKGGVNFFNTCLIRQHFNVKTNMSRVN